MLKVGDVGTHEIDRISELLGLVALHDRSAFLLLHRDSSRKVLRVLMQILRDRNDAEDVLQDVYLRVWLHAARFDATKGTGMSWLVAVSRNLAIDRLRARRQVFSLQEALNKDNTIAFSRANFDYSAETRLIAKAEARRIVDRLRMLETEKATIIMGKYLTGLSHAELALQHNVPMSTMRTRVRRGLLQLKVSLSA